MATSESVTQNITVRLNRRTLSKAKILAAKRNTSISRLLAEQIEALVGETTPTNRRNGGRSPSLTRGFILAAGSNPRATSGTSDKAFVDSNVLIYAHDVDAGRKRDAAKALRRDLWLERTGVLSTQVLHEFYVNVTPRIRRPLAKAEARAVVATYVPWCLGPHTGDVSEAFRIEDEAGISFWDALIVATAARSGATRVLSEDLNPGQSISGVTVVNPFADSAAAPPAQTENY